MENKLLKVSILVSIGGLIILYVIMMNSSVPFVEADNINEKYFGKTIRSEIEFSSIKEYDSSIVIYPKKVNIRLVVFTDEKITIENDTIIEFSGKVDEDEYGYYVILDNIQLRKN